MFETIDQSQEYVDFWNEILVPKFVRYRHVLVEGLTHHSAEILPTLDVREGDRVLDIGCGFGDTAIELARMAGHTGSVVGLDCCEGFLEIARADAATAGVDNVTFLNADAQTHRFEPEFDFVFSRFGTMFFANPVAGLRNMRSALKPGGRMTMIVWRTIDDNPWLNVAKQTVLRFLPPPGDDGRSCGPGPLSMADKQMVEKQMEIAGYEDIRFERIDAPIVVGHSPDDAIGFQLAIGPAGEVFREAGDEAEDKRGEIEAAMREELARYATDEGIVMPSSSWRISAVNPA
jgi:ubiquinone/menaquinone biosynthesis C-methylase UbiE